MDGQRSLALQAGRGFAKLTDDSMFHSLAIVRFGSFDEVAALGERPRHEIPAGMWDFAHGYAQLRRGDRDAARASLDRLSRGARGSTAAFKIHPAKVLLGIVAGILDGEVRRADGDLSGALTAFERAVALQDSLLVDDPEPLPLAARHWLGAALLDARRFADAERVYRDDLGRHPHNGWALVGLQQALKAQGKATASVDDDLRKSWARADVRIPGSRY
jgi:tetratricopeptide (TPR) repeat protein